MARVEARLEGARLMQEAIRDSFNGVDSATMAVWKIREAIMLVKPEEIVKP